MYLHPAIAETAVIGISDAVFGEDICAIVQLRAGVSATPDELREHAARYLSKFKVPAMFVFQAALPRTSTGKVHKQTLREQMTRLKAA